MFYKCLDLSARLDKSSPTDPPAWGRVFPHVGGGGRVASFSRLSSGKWRAQIDRKGKRLSASFESKQAAKDWAAHQEYLILHPVDVGSVTSLGDVFNRYGREVSPLRKGERWEVIRLDRLARDKIALIKMADLQASDLADWRDRRLKEVKPASVAREMNLIGAVLTVARKEWGLLTGNPMADVRKPKKPPPRDRIATDRELEALAISAGSDLTKSTARVFHAFLFACETAMRAGEIVGLTWHHVDLDRQVAHLPETKNGHSRDVPLSKEAIRLLRDLPHADPVFDLDSAQTDALWRKLRDRAAVVDLRFHDSRRTATTRLAKKLDVLELAKMTGHRDLAILLNTYYKQDASQVAKKLD
jgi:integrase